MSPRLVVVGIGCVSAKYLPDALRGYEPVVIADPARYVGAARAALERCVCLPADTGDPADVIRALAERPDLLAGAVGVTTPFDELFPLVERVGEKLGLAHPPAVFAKLADKAAVSALVPEHSPWTAVVDPADIPADLFADAPADVLLKPSLCTGALGVQRLVDRTPAGLLAAIDGSGVPDARGQAWLLQERVDGDLVSLEGYFREGVLTVLGISRRGRIGATEVSNVFPAGASLPDRVRARCVEAVLAVAGRAGLRSGYVHCEFLVTESRACLIDANLGRVGGAGIVEQIALAHQVEPAEVLRHALLLPLDPDVPAPAYRASTRATTSYWYGLRDGGVVRSVTVPDGTPCLHTQFAVPGQRVPAVGVSDYAWIGMFTGLTGDAQRDIDGVAVHTDDGVWPAYCR